MEAKTAWRPRWRSAAATLTLAALTLPAQAAGQEIFKQTDAEGRVIITDNPDPARRILERYPAHSANASALIIVPNPPEAANALNAPWPMQRPTFNRPSDEVQFALDTNSRMSSPRIDAIDAREAARRASAAPAPSPLRFNAVQFKPPSLRRYQPSDEEGSEAGRPSTESRKTVAALPALNWVAGSQVGGMLLLLWIAACMLLRRGVRRRMGRRAGLIASAVRARLAGWMAPSNTA